MARTDAHLKSRARLRNRNRAKWQDVDERLPTLLNDLDQKDIEIVRLRWLQNAEHSDGLWRSHRSVYYGFRVPIIIGAATVPVLASLSVPDIATALVGLAVAILTGLDSFFRFGLRWQQRRHSAVAMESEGWGFLELSGPYAAHSNHKTALTPFLSSLEEINKRLAMAYLDLFREAEPAKSDTPALGGAVLGGELAVEGPGSAG
jgi:hypothetical protein